jgi:hypothetical protein
MDVRQELQGLGFIHAGAIRPVDSGTNCEAVFAPEFPARARHVVFALVADDQIKKFGQTSKGIKARIGGHASALRKIMEDPAGRRLDPFKRLAPKVMEANQEIDVWARESTAATCAAERRELNLKYRPEWVARPG